MLIYQIVLEDYESKETNVLISNRNITQDEFQHLCNSYIDEAPELAIESATKKGKLIEYIGWNHVIKNLINLLIQKENFISPIIISSNFFGGGLIGIFDQKSNSMSEKTYNKIKLYNENYQKEIHKDE